MIINYGLSPHADKCKLRQQKKKETKNKKQTNKKANNKTLQAFIDEK